MSAHVAFDFDGTLVRSNRIKRDCFHEVAAGVPGASEVLDELFAGGFEGDRLALFRELIARLARRGAAGLPEPGALAAAYGAKCRARIAAAPEVPGAGEALARLRAAGARLFLVSATPQGALDEIVADRGLAGFFELVLGGPTAKPAHLRRVLAEFGLAPAELVLVGDGHDDRDAAAALGCRFIAVTDQPKAPFGPETPGIADLRDLPRLIGIAEPGAGAAAGRGAE